MLTEHITQIVSAGVGVACFAALYNVRGKKLIFTTLGGILSWSMFLILNGVIGDEAICYFAVSGSITVYSEILARCLKTPTSIFIIPSLIPLIPGSSLYYTIASAFEGTMNIFSDRLVHTLKLAAALALGIILVSAFTRIILKLKFKSDALKRR